MVPVPDRLLTLLFGARNDTYMGDFKYRFSTCLNYLAQNLKAIGRLQDVEVLVVDWNSDVPLHSVLPLSDDARSLARFIVVPPALARPAQRDSPFPIPIVQNVAIRRARGEFIGQTDSDILFTRASLLALFHVLDGDLPDVPLRRALLVGSRRHVPFQQVLRKPRLKELDAYLMRNGAVFPREDFFPGFATPSALALLHRDLWQACRGYDERLIYWGWMEIDLYLRLTQRMPWFDVAAFGVNLLHIEHYTSPRATAKNPRKMNPTPTSTAFEANDDQWGMMEHQLGIVAALPCAAEAESVPPADTVESVTAALTAAPVAECVGRFTQAVQLRPEHCGSLYPLAWYALERFPRTYVDIGSRFAATAALVASACPGVEIYGIDSWAPDSHGAEFPIWRTSNAVAQFGSHRNYTRFVSGDPNTALERLFASESAPNGIDLALLRTDPAFGDAVKNGLTMAAHLTPGGALVVSSQTAASFDAVWNAILEEHPAFLRIKPPGVQQGLHIGLLLAPQNSSRP